MEQNLVDVLTWIMAWNLVLIRSTSEWSTWSRLNGWLTRSLQVSEMIAGRLKPALTPLVCYGTRRLEYLQIPFGSYMPNVYTCLLPLLLATANVVVR